LCLLCKVIVVPIDFSINNCPSTKNTQKVSHVNWMYRNNPHSWYLYIFEQFIFRFSQYSLSISTRKHYKIDFRKNIYKYNVNIQQPYFQPSIAMKQIRISYSIWFIVVFEYSMVVFEYSMSQNSYSSLSMSRRVHCAMRVNNPTLDFWIVSGILCDYSSRWHLLIIKKHLFSFCFEKIYEKVFRHRPYSLDLFFFLCWKIQLFLSE